MWQLFHYGKPGDVFPNKIDGIIALANRDTGVYLVTEHNKVIYFTKGWALAPSKAPEHRYVVTYQNRPMAIFKSTDSVIHYLKQVGIVDLTLPVAVGDHVILGSATVTQP
jgi:hypothetical protein